MTNQKLHPLLRLLLEELSFESYASAGLPHKVLYCKETPEELNNIIIEWMEEVFKEIHNHCQPVVYDKVLQEILHLPTKPNLESELAKELKQHGNANWDLHEYEILSNASLLFLRKKGVLKE